MKIGGEKNVFKVLLIKKIKKMFCKYVYKYKKIYTPNALVLKKININQNENND